MAKPKKNDKKPALKNAGKVSIAPDTEKIVTKPAPKSKTTKKATVKPAPVAKPSSVKAAKPVEKKVAKKEGGKKKHFKTEPHMAHPPSEKRNFMLLDANHEDIGKFTGKSPRQAALKIANTGVVDITIRETGQRRTRNTPDGKVAEYKIHYYTGSRIQRPKTDKDPDWMPDMVNIPHVEKLGSEWIPVDT